MNVGFKFWLLSISAFTWSMYSFGQSECANFAYLIGEQGVDERGYSLAVASDQSGLYLAGIKEDSALIMHLNLYGGVRWIRTFDIVPMAEDHISVILVDSEGMIAAAGTAGVNNNGAVQGRAFVFRYNPIANQVIWARELRNSTNHISFGMTELGPGGNYLVSNNLVLPNDTELQEFDRDDGDQISTFAKQYFLGSSQTLADLILYGGKLYGIGRFTDGGTVAGMRHTVMRMNPANGQIEWIRLGHRPSSTTARLYAFDMVIHDNHIISLGCGDDNGASLNDTKLYVYKHTLDGQLVWAKEYDIPGFNDWAEEILLSKDGYAILGRNRISSGDITLMKIDHDGALLWAKQFDFAPNDNLPLYGGTQSSLVEVDEHYYFTAFAEESNEANIILVKIDLDGNTADSCMEVRPVLVNARDVTNPVFYSVQPDIFSATSTVHSLFPQSGVESSLPVNKTCLPYPDTANIHVEICMGEEYEGYNTEGTYIDTFISSQGCDSVRILEVSVVPGPNTELFITICEGDSFEGYWSSGTYVNTFIASNGCDSIRTLYLDVGSPTVDLSVTICRGNHFDFYSEPGLYVDTIVGVNGACDTIRRLELIVTPELSVMIKDTICSGESLFGYESDGIYVDTFSTIQGCDSVRILDLDVLTMPETSYSSLSVCDQESAFVVPGVYIDTLNTSNGCDSIVTYEVTGFARFIPNVFSPNGDGINDIFEIDISLVNNFQLEYFAIFDRFGGSVYEVSEWPVHWNGDVKPGEQATPGVFVYVFSYLCNEKKVIESGDITLVR